MNQVAYLDPSSLSLWVDIEDIGTSGNGALFQEVFQSAVFRDFENLLSALSEIKDSDDLAFGFHLISTVWHENRHFVDLILTNYGAFRIRQFFSIYINQGPLLNGAISRNHNLIFLPLDTYADPVRSMVLEANPWSDNVLPMAHDITKRREDLVFDRAVLKRTHGSIDIGGNGQLESLAYLNQFMAIQHFFGPEASMLAQKSLNDNRKASMRYRGVEQLAYEFNLISTKFLSDAKIVEYNINTVNFLFSILIASLMCRRFARRDGLDTPGEARDPSLRFASYLKELKGRRVNSAEISTFEGWQLVNEISSKLWGRTIIQELEADYEEEERLIEITERSDSVMPLIKKAWADLHRLRGVFIKLFKGNPNSFVEPISFAHDILPSVQPMPIMVSKNGKLGEPPETWRQAFGYKDPNIPGTDSRWWWAVYPDEWPPSDFCLCLQETQAWNEIIEFHGPLAKMMINGRRHRTILGPELIMVQATIEDSLGIKIAFDPSFEFPDEQDDIGHYYALRRQSNLICDLCKSEIHKPEGHVISPWYFRRNNNTASFAIELYNGGDSGMLKFWRDWSPWIACNECFAELNHLFTK